MDRVAVDITSTITGRTGITRYVEQLVAAIWETTTDVELALFAVGRGTEPVLPGARRARVPLRIVDAGWRALHAPKVERLVGAIGSVHASGPAVPAARAPIVGVVYDLAPLDRPDLHPKRSVVNLRRYLAELRRASAVITISETTATQLVRHGIDEAKVVAIPIGATPLGEPVRPPLAGTCYVLAVGAPVPRKGFSSLVDAVAQLDDDVALVVVGPHGSDDDELRERAAAHGIAHRFHRVGPVTDAELAGWYRDAGAVAAPSIDEGFGLPLVEAMQQRVPVVASDIGVFREVSGGHATLVPVGDVSALADALTAAVGRPTAIESTLDAARTHASRYTWQACADATLAVHRRVQR